MSLDELKAEKCRHVNELRENKLKDFFVFSGARFDCDDTSRQNIAGALLIGMANQGQMPEGFVWRDYDDHLHPANFQFIAAMAQALAAHTNQVYVTSWQHKNAINAHQAQEVLNEYDFYSGW